MTIDAKEVLTAARAETGLSDLGDEGILEGLDVLCNALNREANLNARGEMSARKEFVDTLANRLRVEDYLKKHPELLERPIEKPMFVFGLPRTGTTLVINLLSVDPARRCFLRWEAFDSVPPPRPEDLHAGPRYEKAQAMTEMALKYAPEISAIHHENGDSPCECQFSMSPSFCTQVYDSIYNVPSYHKWFFAASYLPAFRYQKRLLQMLQSEAPGHWTLKNPWHPLYLNDLTTVYPDAQLVMTHRDPVDVVASACSLLKHVRHMFSDEVDLKAIARLMLETFDEMIKRMLAYRQAHGWDSIYDLHYSAVMADPIGEIKKLYKRFDEPLSETAEANMRTYLADNPQGKHGKHSYSLEEYGLTREEVRARYADYCRKFQIEQRA
jgi:hypothetical protein